MTIKVYNKFGALKDLAWLREKYGPLVIHPANVGPGWRVAELWERADLSPEEIQKCGQDVVPIVVAMGMPGTWTPDGGIKASNSLIVTLRDENWEVVPGYAVAWYWPDAPEDWSCGPANGVPEGMDANRAEYGFTNDNGDMGFGMYGGSWYGPPVRGPHAVWLYGAELNSDVVFGLGMLIGPDGPTNHDHIDVVYQWEPEEEPPPSDEVRLFLDLIEQAAEGIVCDVEAVRGLL